MTAPRPRRWWPTMNDELPRHDRLAPRCGACHHPEGDHLDGRTCARWLTVASSAEVPPEVVLCPCPGLRHLRIPGLHPPPPRSAAD